MKISELSLGNNRVSLEAIVRRKLGEREVVTRFGKILLREFEIEDESGKVKLVTWGRKIGSNVNVGDRIRIENGFVTSFRGELQLNVGRYGNLEVI